MADYQWHPAYMDYTRRMGVTPSAQGQVDFLMRNNMGWGVTQGGGGGSPPPATPPPVIPPTGNPPIQPPPSPPPSGGGGGGGGSSYPPGGGGGSTTSGGSTTTTSTGGSMDSSTLPYIKSVTSNPGTNNNGLISSLIASLSKGTADANKAGLAQYQNLLNAINGGSKSAMNMYKQAGQQIDNYGASQKQDIEQARQQEYGSTTQDLIGRGLGNTTITPTMLGGVNQRAQRSQIQLGDAVAGMKSGLLTQQAGAKIDLTKLMGDSILSRQNVGPNMGMYLNLLQSLGMGGGGTGARMMA